MKKVMLFALTLLLGWSCQKDQEQLTPANPVPEATVNTEKQIPLERIFYHKATEQYVYQKGDPYSFENMKRVYEKMQAKRQEQFGTRAGGVGNIELTPTHYSLKIYPRNESEQWRVERMEDVMVAYLPFDYAPLPEDDMEVMSLTRSMIEPFEEEVRYTVTYDNLQSVEGPQPSETLEMPVLYVTWPATKPLPLDLDYEIVDQLLLPTSWDDRIPFPGFDTLRPVIPTPEPITIRGRVLDWDQTLQEYAPIPELKVRLTNGSLFYETYTDEYGIFTFNGTANDFGELRVQFMLSTDRWKIVRANSTIPVSITNGRVNSYWPSLTGNIPTYDFELNSDLPDYEITRGLFYFYYGDHPIYKWVYEEGLKIETGENSSEGWAGAFYYPSEGQPAYISVFNTLKDGNYPDCSIIGSLLHEIGHFCQNQEIGNSLMRNTHNLLKESYANYVGWHLVTSYYDEFLSYNLPVTAAYQSRQGWTKYSTSVYTPLFVDLFDDYDQHTNNPNRPNDQINNFSHSSVRFIVRLCRNWESCRSYLANYVGTYYTQEQFDNYVSNYDYWFENN